MASDVPSESMSVDTSSYACTSPTSPRPTVPSWRATIRPLMKLIACELTLATVSTSDGRRATSARHAPCAVSSGSAVVVAASASAPWAAVIIPTAA